MIDSSLYPTEELDNIINSRLLGEFENMQGYVFEGTDYNKINFNRLQVFYDNKIFDKAYLVVNQLIRWINAYYWYSVYMNELKNQNISIENHKQLRFKLIERIDHYTIPDFDWTIIEKIDNEFELK